MIATTLPTISSCTSAGTSNPNTPAIPAIRATMPPITDFCCQNGLSCSSISVAPDVGPWEIRGAQIVQMNEPTTALLLHTNASEPVLDGLAHDPQRPLSADGYINCSAGGVWAGCTRAAHACVVLWTAIRAGDGKREAGLISQR